MATTGFAHLGLKVVSVVLAALLWLLVSREQVVERVMRVPLEFASLPAALEIVGDTPDVVDVRVRGSSGALGRVAAGQLVAVLDLRSAREGRRIFHLGSDTVRAPSGLEAVQVTPSSLSIRFEASVVKLVPVVPEVDGLPSAGFEISTVAANPETVEVVGPASVVNRLTKAVTEPVSVAGATGPVSEAVTVGVLESGARLRAPVTARVTVTVTRRRGP